MNWWDFFTWFSAAGLAASAVVIFAFFLKDIGGILKRVKPDDEEDG